MEVLAKGFSKPTTRIQKLREEIFNAVPALEADRAVLLTESYKATENEPVIIRRAKAVAAVLRGIPTALREGELISGVMAEGVHNCQVYPEFSYQWIINEFDTMATRMADPFVITTDTKEKMRQAFSYWDGKTTHALATSYMSQKCLEAQSQGVFSVGNYYFNGVGHICVDYGKVLRLGFSGILKEVAEAKNKLSISDPKCLKKREFYDAVTIIYTAAIDFAHRYADLAAKEAEKADGQRKQELLQMAANCLQVPEYPAANWWEALQSFWFVQLIMQLESNGHSVSPGRFDQYMYPYLKMDQVVSPDVAQELLDSLWIKMNDLNKTRDEISDQAFAGYQCFQNIQCGGQTEEGEDATNELSYMMIDASAHVAMASPSFSIRYWSKSPDEFLFRACELVRLGYGYPAMYNDEVIIPALENRGVTLRDARNYSLIGCVEPTIPHKTLGWHDAGFFNISKILEITLHNGRVGQLQMGPKSGEAADFHSLEELMKAYKTQMKYFVALLVEACNAVDLAHMERCPLPFESALVDDCIVRGLSAEEGGAVYNFSGPQAFGVADNGDSLMAIKKHVFEKQEVAMTDLIEALDHNFGYPDMTGKVTRMFGGGQTGGTYAKEPSEDMDKRQIYEIVKRLLSANGEMNVCQVRQQLENNSNSGDTNERYRQIRKIVEQTTWFGNDDDEVDRLAREAGQIYAKEVEKYTNPRGGKFQAGCYPVSANVLFGKDVAALPDGRLAWEPLADGVSPRAGCDTNGPTAAAMSVCKLGHEIYSNGTLYNQKYVPSALAGDEGLKRFEAVVRAYFEGKGMHVQFNVIDRATLVDAQQHPEQHKDLVVRVAGYSAQFISLAKEVQDNIIDRSELKC